MKTGIEDAKYTYVLDPLCVLFDGIYMLEAIEEYKGNKERWRRAAFKYAGYGLESMAFMICHLRRWAPKVLHMPRKGSRCRITPRPEGCLDNALRVVSELYLVLHQH